jgi:hypothetical protein
MASGAVGGMRGELVGDDAVFRVLLVRSSSGVTWQSIAQPFQPTVAAPMPLVMWS